MYDVVQYLTDNEFRVYHDGRETLGDESTPLDEKILIVTSLSSRARAYAQKPETAQSAIDISLQIIELFPEIDDGGLSREIHLANEHTTLGLAYKVLKQWEKALEHDYISADIYKRIYESSHGSDAFTKYRERVFNIANVIEAWAIDEEDNLSLWQRSCDAFDEAYRLDMLAIGSNANERDIIRCSSTIQSYGSSLIKVGRLEDGLSKYREAVSIVEDIAKNRPNPEIYVDFCITIMEIIHQLTLINRYTEAREFALNLSKSITYVFDSENKLCIEKINELLPHISNALNERLSELFAVSDLENSIWICRLLCDVYLAFLKIAPDEVRYNIIILTKNIANIYFLKIQDYELAYREYMHLFEVIEQYGLITPDESGKYNENLNARLGDPYIRIMVCLERLGRIDEAKAVASEMGRFIEYILSITYSYESDPLILAYMTAMGMTKFSREMSICLVEQGLELAKAEPFRKKSSLGTVAKMTMLLNNLRNGG